MAEGSMEEEMPHDAMTALRSELAALQYKRDRLMSELNEMRTQMRCRDQKADALMTESESLREQAARQNAIIASLKKRVQELEERERALSGANGRSEAALQTLQRENKFQEEKMKELGKRVRSLEVECHGEEQAKLAARGAMCDFVRRLSNALGTVDVAETHTSQDCLSHKAAELVQETSRLRSRSCTMSETLNSVELELRSCREALERAVSERDAVQRQAGLHLVELDRLRQEKEELEVQQRMAERELADLREKLCLANKNLGCANMSSAAQDATICQLRDECKVREERGHRLQNELRHLLETLAITLSTPARFVESTEEGVKARIREVVLESKEKCLQIDALKEKVHMLSGQLGRQNEIGDRARVVEEEKAILEARLGKLQEDLQHCEMSRESLRRDKNTFMNFLERLGRALNTEELSKDAGVELHTEALLIRAEQLARLETDKIVDKTSAVYQLQRRVRTLKEQLQRKDLHLDLLRRKLTLQEENCRVRSAITSERDEANLRCKKLAKQVERLQIQLVDARTLSQDLKNQLAEAGDFKIAALERGRKVEELQKRLVESEVMKNRYNRKVTLLKDQVRATSQSADQERTISEHSQQLLKDDLNGTRVSLAETTRRESQLLTFRSSVCKVLAVVTPATDYEIISKLEKLAAAHREFTLLSRRYDDPVGLSSPAPARTPRYEDSGFLDQAEAEDSDDVFQKRPHPRHGHGHSHGHSHP